jgi:hypothetical protein
MIAGDIVAALGAAPDARALLTHAALRRHLRALLREPAPDLPWSAPRNCCRAPSLCPGPPSDLDCAASLCPMNGMQFDFSALDAELESLGRAPRTHWRWARRYAPPGWRRTPRQRAPSRWTKSIGPWPRSRKTTATDLAPAPVWSAPELPLDAACPAWRAKPRQLRAGAPRSCSARSRTQPRASAAASRARTPRTLEAPAAPESLPPPPSPCHRCSRVLVAPARVATACARSVPPPAQARPAALTQTRRSCCPIPIACDELSTESGELRLDGDDPSSGSFELPETSTEPRISPAEPAAQRRAAGPAPRR